MQKKILARDIKLKRAYGPPSARDGTRILIDRLWPRGVRKSDAAIDRWIKDIAPSRSARGAVCRGTQRPDHACIRRA
jgi:uncharacterized protein YeaO (DUF488 family)